MIRWYGFMAEQILWKCINETDITYEFETYEIANVLPFLNEKITPLNGLIYRFFRVWYKMGHMKKAVSWAPATSAIRTSRCLCPWSFIWLLNLMPTCPTVQRRYLYFQRLLPKLEAVWSAQRGLWRGRARLCHDHSVVACTMPLWHLPKPQHCSLPDSQAKAL